ncbi:MAG TPA: substrate-binding domain-containing protein [Ruminiclostridium sp.]|nr:substrate-binding domain-containing protein [Ruminiclostridium sp.]
MAKFNCLKITKPIFLLIAVIIALSGCTGSGAGKKGPVQKPGTTSENSPVTKLDEPVIAMVPKSLDNPVFLDALEQGELVGRELGIKVEWLGSMQSNSNEQVAIVESLVRRRVDGIVISCIDPEKMRPVIDKAVSAGIKVATFDSDSPDSARLFYCGTNNYAAGEACGRALINVLKSKGKDREVLKLLVMTADKKSNNLNERLKGFLDVARNGGISLNIIDTLYCNDDVNIAGDMLDKYIRTGGKPDVFFGTGGWPFVSPPESLPAFRAWCKSGGTSILIDTYYPVLEAAQQGMADALVGQNFKKMGELSIRNLYKAIKGEKIPSSFIDTGLELGNKGNYAKLLQGKQRWEIK